MSEVNGGGSEETGGVAGGPSSEGQERSDSGGRGEGQDNEPSRGSQTGEEDTSTSHADGGEAGPVKQPEDRVPVSNEIREKYAPNLRKDQEPSGPDDLLEAVKDYVKDPSNWRKAAVNAELVKKTLESEEANPPWAQPPNHPEDRVQYEDHMRRHYNESVDQRTWDIRLKTIDEQVPRTSGPSLDVSINRNDLCTGLEGPEIRAFEPTGTDTMPETDLRTVDQALSEDRELAELKQLARDAEASYNRAVNDLERSRGTSYDQRKSGSRIRLR